MEEEKYTVDDLIDYSVADVPDLSYLHSEFDDYGYSDANGAITDEAIEVGTEQLEKIHREGEEVIADINAQILERITEQQNQVDSGTDSDSDSDSTDSDSTDSATSE
jgi:hypothetical protein